MKLLLDTHIWVWSLEDPRKLSRKVASSIRRAAELYVSPLSAWEVLLLAQRGRVRLKPDPVQWVRNAWAQGPYAEVPLTLDVVLASSQVFLPHRDPVDILLAATARAYGLTLVTADQPVLKGSGFSMLANE